MLQVKQEAGAVGVRAAGKWAVPGDDICDRQTRHPVVGQSQVAVLLAAPYRAEKKTTFSQSTTLTIKEIIYEEKIATFFKASQM